MAFLEPPSIFEIEFAPWQINEPYMVLLVGYAPTTCNYQLQVMLFNYRRMEPRTSSQKSFILTRYEIGTFAGQISHTPHSRRVYKRFHSFVGGLNFIFDKGSSLGPRASSCPRQAHTNQIN